MTGDLHLEYASDHKNSMIPNFLGRDHGERGSKTKRNIVVEYFGFRKSEKDHDGGVLLCLFLDPPMWVPITKPIHYVYGCRIFVMVSLGMLYVGLLPPRGGTKIGS